MNHIFPVGSPWCKTNGEQKLHISSSDLIILIGPNERTNLSLLFQAAVSYASEESSVSFICQKPLSTLPKCVHGMPQPDTKTLNTLKFMYLSTADELTEYCSSIHLKTVLPDVLIVADFHLYLGHGQLGEHTAARLLALLLDTVKYIKTKSQSTDCKLVISCSNNVKWISSVARKFDFQIVRLIENEDCVCKMEWEAVDRQHLLTFRIGHDQIFMNKLCIQEMAKDL